MHNWTLGLCSLIRENDPRIKAIQPPNPLVPRCGEATTNGRERAALKMDSSILSMLIGHEQSHATKL